jgi:multidrug resistance efflux pump
MIDTKVPQEEINKQEEKRLLKQRRKRKKMIKRIVTTVVVLAVVGGIWYGIASLFREEEVEKEILTDFVYRGSIQSLVTGSGVTRAKDATTITLGASGTVLDVYVSDGQLVSEGDPLYTIDSTEAVEAVQSAQKTVNNYEKQLAALYEAYENLDIRAPYSGKLLNVKTDIEVGDELPSGVKLGTLVDDRTMKLKLYFSYAYENDIYVGQPAQISIPVTMSILNGRVSEVSRVRKVTDEGAILFEVVFTLDNPGGLTEDMGASVVLNTAAGESIYPYEPGKLMYNRTTDIETKVSGEVLSVNLVSFADVSQGERLLLLTGDDAEEQIAALENQLKAARETLEKAKENLDNFNAMAPMSGTVLSCNLKPGEKVEAGRVAVSIADTTVMTVEARIDEMNVSYIKPGMMCTVTQWGRLGQQTFMGLVESVSLEGKFENGISYFPAIIKVDNPDGSLMTGMYVDYSMVASQSDDCLLVPVQAVKYTSEGTCLFIKADSPPENALDPEVLGIEIPEGFYAVPVQVGLSDNSSAEILEGVEEGTEVFTQYMTDRGDMFGGGIRVY